MDSLKRLFNSMYLEKPSLGAPEGTMKIAPCCSNFAWFELAALRRISEPRIVLISHHFFIASPIPTISQQ